MFRHTFTRLIIVTLESPLLQEKISELEAYNALKEARLSDALDALKEVRYISNCTEKLFQMGKKIRLSQEIDSVQISCPNYYRTITNLPFTVLKMSF